MVHSGFEWVEEEARRVLVHRTVTVYGCTVVGRLLPEEEWDGTLCSTVAIENLAQ